MTIQQFEEVLRKNLSVQCVSEIKGISFDSYTSFLDLYKQGAVSVRTIYQPNVVSALGSPGEKVMHVLCASSPFIVSLGVVLPSFMLWNFWFLFGIPLAFIGMVSSNPAIQRKTGVFIASAFLYFIYACFTAMYIGVVLAGSYLFSLFLCSVAREVCNQVMIRSLLASELVLIWLYLSHWILVDQRVDDVKKKEGQAT